MTSEPALQLGRLVMLAVAPLGLAVLLGAVGFLLDNRPLVYASAGITAFGMALTGGFAARVARRLQMVSIESEEPPPG